MNSNFHAVPVKIVENNSGINDENESELLRLERLVERGIYQAWKALKEIKERRLYKISHSSFESYCKERFGFTRDSAYLKIKAADIYENLEQNLPTNGRQFPMPTSERQLRDIAKAQLEAAEVVQVWLEAVEASDGKIPSSVVVKDIVQRIKEKNPIPNPYRVGEVGTIIVKGNLTLRGKSGCWAIVKEVKSMGCIVSTWSGEIYVKIENLKLIDYSPDQREQMQKINARLSKLALSEINEETVRGFLEKIGQIKRSYLTELEEEMLCAIEKRYGSGG